MKSVIPFNKEIMFKTNIAEITSISLEHNYDVKNDKISGNFIVSGDYKAHEVSVNKEPFKYTLPFEIDIDEDIIKDSLTLNIEDFSYEFREDILKVNIEFSVCGEREVKEEKEEKDEKEERIEKVEEVIEDKELDTIFEDPNSLFEEERTEDVVEVPVEEKIEEIAKDIEDENREAQIIGVDENNSKEAENMIMDSIDTKDEYVTYNVHIVSETETLESICKQYEVTNSFIADYNDITNIGAGDKLIIPIYKDE